MKMIMGMMMRMIMGMVMRMIKGMVSVWYRARQKRRLIKDTDSKIQNKIAFLAPQVL